MRVAVYCIAKNEAHHIARWAESAKDADVRLVLDTGSTDDTVAVARQLGCEVHSAVIDPWRFDQARNMSLDIVPSDIDMCIALDADEELQPGWRAALEAADPPVTRPRYKYTWSWNDDGTPGLIYYGDKIHSRHGYVWKHPVHEVITPTITEVFSIVDLEIHHHPDPGKGRNYLPLLEMSVAEDPDDDRNAHYLGREYVFQGMPDKAAAELKRHLSLPRAVWPAERARSMRLLASCEPAAAEAWLMRSAAEDPHHREQWLSLAQHYYSLAQWEQCLAAAVRCLSITERTYDYLSEAECWGWQPYDLAAVSCHFLGLPERAADYGLEAVRRGAGDQRLLTNMGHYLKELPNYHPGVDVIIPTKSNPAVVDLVRKLVASPSILRVIVVADGREAHDRLQDDFDVLDGSRIVTSYVPLGSGIHAMWNVGLAKNVGSPALFLNDDVTINGATVHGLFTALERCPELGLVCPNYAGERLDDGVIYRSVTDTCRGRYDGTGGLAGFAMMLRSSLVRRWRFDESMKWWYGDDDLVRWTTRTMGMAAGITALATCSDNSSWTIDNDPPSDFAAIVENDRTVFERKWS